MGLAAFQSAAKVGPKEKEISAANRAGFFLFNFIFLTFNSHS